MKPLFIFFSLFITFSTINSQQKISESINTFSFSVLNQLNSGKENCFFSPYSIFSALSMTYAGVRKETKQEFEKLLQIDSKDKIHKELKELSDASSLERELTLLSSNSVWLKEGLNPDKGFIEILENQYNSQVKNVNFSDENQRDMALNQINGLVEKETKGNILNFLQKGILDPSTSMVLINAVYFRAIWKTEFAKENVKADKFKTPSGDSIPCEMMNTSIETGYFEDNLFQVLEIPYQNGKAAMIVFLPKENSSLSNKDFNYSYLQQSSKSFSSKLVNLGLPKFDVEANYDLSDALKKLGLKTAFSPEGDFTGISASEKLFIDKILHKSKISVSEKGTEASSATAVISMRSTKISQEPVNFKANRPFYFVIRENQNKVILFIGYLANPAKV